MEGRVSGKYDNAGGGGAAAAESSGSFSRDEGVQWRRDRRRSELHRSTTDSEARLSPATLAADSGCDDGEVLRERQRAGITPHVTMSDGRLTSNDERGGARRRKGNSAAS